MAIKDLSETAASNTSIDGVNTAEGTAMSNLNNGIRSVAAFLRQGIAGSTATVPSSPTCDIASPLSNFISVSGQSQINGFSAGSPGLIKFLQFQSVLTLNASASILTPGNASISVLANDIAQVRYESSVITRLIGLTRGAGVGILTGLITGSGLTAPSSVLLGRISAGTGAIETINIGASLALATSTLNANVAAQADMEAASSTVLLVTPGRAHFHPGVAKVWAKISWGGAAALSEDYGVTSLTDSGTGDITLNFATNFANTTYAPIITHGDNSAAAVLMRETIFVSGSLAVGSCQFQAFAAFSTTNPTRSLNDPVEAAVVIFGDF